MKNIQLESSLEFHNNTKWPILCFRIRKNLITREKLYYILYPSSYVKRVLSKSDFWTKKENIL